MPYHISTTVDGDFADVVDRVTAGLAEQGFGVLTKIDVQATMRAKLDVELHPYVILGACNPQFAHRALEIEDKIGTMLPCNVIVQQKPGEAVEVSAVDPLVSMQGIDNPELEPIARQVRDRLSHVVSALAD